MNDKVKVRYVFTVIRNEPGKVSMKQLKEHLDFFGAIKDETGEYLYGGSSLETISVKLQKSEDNGKTWVTIDETNEH